MGRLAARRLAARVLQLETSPEFVCVLFESGHVKCWGTDSQGYLGQGTTGLHVSDPSTVDPIDFGTSRRAVELSVGALQSCVRFEDNRIRCWGDNTDGQLGVGRFEPAWGDSPERLVAGLPDVDLDNVVMVRSGYKIVCALVAENDAQNAYCWGDNFGGALGIGSTTDQGLPTQAVGLGQSVRDIAVGGHTVCALLESREVRCWGMNDAGELGLGEGSPGTVGDTSSNLPSSDAYNVVGLPSNTLVDIEGRSLAFCALSETQVWCWGTRGAAQRGIGYPKRLRITSGPRARQDQSVRRNALLRDHDQR